MTEEVLATPRKPLTERQLLTIWERDKGKCCICGKKIDALKGWIDTGKGPKGFQDEHKKALGLGGPNKLENRGPAHYECAGVKTKSDMKRINKAKNQKAIAINTPSEPTIESRGFKPSGKPKRESRAPVPGKTAMARRYQSGA